MTNEVTILQRIVNKIRGFIEPRMPRWLADWGFSHVLDRCTVTGDWATGMPISELYDRWMMEPYQDSETEEK
jgi:hypothetical protein